LKKIVGKDNPNEILTIKLEELEELYQLSEKDLTLDKQLDIRALMSMVQPYAIKGNFDRLEVDLRNDYINRLNKFISYLENL